MQTGHDCASLKRGKGFSLIELLIVVSIILIIASIAIPSLLKSRQAANQASTVGSLRTISTAEVTYSTTYTTGYSSTLIALDGTALPATAASAGLIDSVLGGAVKSTYGFSYFVNTSATAPCANPPSQGGVAAIPPSTNTTYSLNASPILCVPGNGNYYFTDQSGVIRMNNSAAAGPGDNPLAG